MRGVICSSLFLLLSASGCAVDGGSAPDSDVPVAVAQTVYYGDGRPGTPDNASCGRHSAVGLIERADKSRCSAVLVRNNIALTVQHCQIVAGQATLSFPGTPNDDPKAPFKIIKVAHAPGWLGYRDRPDPEDISVVQLDRAVPRYVAQPMWMPIDPPESLGLSLSPYHNPDSNDYPELCGYGGTKAVKSGEGAGVRRFVPAISLEWTSDDCNEPIFEGACWSHPFWKYGTDFEATELNFSAEGDSGGALIGYVKGLKQRGFLATTYKRDGIVPALLGVLSGTFHDNFLFETEEGEISAATFNNSTGMRDFLAQNVYGIPEAPYETIPGPSVSQMAIYGTDWGVQVDDRAVVYGTGSGYGNVGSNPLGWLGCRATPTTATPDVIDADYFSLFGPDSHVGNVWANDNLRFHDRANVHGTAYAEGDISVITQAVVPTSQPRKRIALPTLNVTGTSIPSGATCSSIALEPDRSQTAPTNCVYIPSVTVKSRSALRFPCSSVPYHIGNLSTEPDSGLVFDLARCANAQVYIHGDLSFKGSISFGTDPASAVDTKVLFVVTSSGKVDVQSGFNGVLMAPNGFIHLAPGQEHYGAFYGKHVYLEQDSKLYFRPFKGALPLR